MSIQSTYGINSADFNLPTFPITLVPAKGPNRLVCIQQILFWPNMWAQSTLTFSDSLSGFVIGILNVPATPPQVGDSSNGLFLTFLPTGTLLSAGAGLNMSVSINGASGRLHLETYQKGPVFTIAPYVAPSAATLAANIKLASFGV